MTMYFYACFPCHSTSSKFYCPSSIGFLVCFAWPELCLFIAVVFMGSSMGSKRRSSRSNSTWWTIAGEQLNSTRFFRREKPFIPSFVVPFLHFLRLRATSAASTGRLLKNCWKFSVFFFFWNFLLCEVPKGFWSFARLENTLSLQNLWVKMPRCGGIFCIDVFFHLESANFQMKQESA